MFCSFSPFFTNACTQPKTYAHHNLHHQPPLTTNHHQPTIDTHHHNTPLPPPPDDIQHYSADDCQVTPVIHVLQYPGCVPKPIPSFACVGRCASYIQVSGSKIWQMERSCMCCQESGEREASVSLFCPKAKNGEKKFKKVHHPLCT
ncbi:bursicon-like [Topomyia yanbarensis]|uniref:bursicon-like n=1 Tax=Topomyia yanbarensis TaxID=2498891 RepID=UPI00273B00F1|nr:bursicon-like [Topomyia yanbarensis]XP_058822570.1 bursicon-like [Topomyia yanbarensis]